MTHLYSLILLFDSMRMYNYNCLGEHLFSTKKVMIMNKSNWKTSQRYIIIYAQHSIRLSKTFKLLNDIAVCKKIDFNCLFFFCLYV